MSCPDKGPMPELQLDPKKRANFLMVSLELIGSKLTAHEMAFIHATRAHFLMV
jgi:hypothetical protein